MDAWASPTPATSSVLIDQYGVDGRYRFRLTNLVTFRDRLTYSSSVRITQVAALRGDQAVLFGDYDGATVHARFMSVGHPQPVLLGAWEYYSCRGCSFMPLHPDPTGCFTVVGADVASGTGTRLVLLPQ